MEHPLEIESFDEMRHQTQAAGPQNGHGQATWVQSQWNDHILGQNKHQFTLVLTMKHTGYGLKGLESGVPVGDFGVPQFPKDMCPSFFRS